MGWVPACLWDVRETQVDQRWIGRARGHGAGLRRRSLAVTTVALGWLGAMYAPPVAADTPCPLITPWGCPTEDVGTAPEPTTTTTAAPATTTTTVAPDPSPSTGPRLSSQEAETHLLDLVNGERRRRNLPLLAGRGDVIEIARGWSTVMAGDGRLRHNDDYFRSSTRSRLKARLLGENVAYAPSVEEAHRRLMASDGHRRNILNARFSIVGIGTVFQNDRWWITQDFLQPRHPAPTPPAQRAAGSSERLAVASAPDDATRVPVARPLQRPPLADNRIELEEGNSPSRLFDDLVPNPQPDDPFSVAALPAGLLVFLLWLGPGLWWFTRRRGDTTHDDATKGAAPSDLTREHLTRVAVGHHQLKTKLAVTCGWSMTLLERWDVLAEPDRKSIVDILARASREAATIADHLLLDERAVAVEHDVRLVDLDLRAFLEDFIPHAQALTHDHHLRVNTSNEHLPAQADSAALQLVLEQLLENAAKYAPAGTEIVITAHTTNEAPAITVTDQGPGFPDDLDPFTAGERGDRTTTGNGLGLYIARSLITAMHGTIDIIPGPGGAVRLTFTPVPSTDVTPMPDARTCRDVIRQG